MKNTKTLILETALRLFNQQGLSQVSLRTIALEMRISQGNLNYHFKKREDILEALYQELVAKIDANVVLMTHQELDLKVFFEQSKALMHYFYEYRFFMLDFVQIMREQTTIRAHYQQLQQVRELQFLEILQGLIQQGFIREKELEKEYENFYIRLTIMGDFWLSSAINAQELKEDLVTKYNLIIFESLYPYLTKKGKKAFGLVVKN